MKYLFLFIVLAHGLIHLMGFVKAFNLADITQLNQSISKPFGIIWLLSASLFITTAVLFSLNKDWWWLVTTIAVVISQLLIIYSWEDAKFGTIVNILILVIGLIGFANWYFNTQTTKEIDSLLSNVKSSQNMVITHDMLETYPPQVQRWLANIGMIGKDKIQTAYLKHNGFMKLKPDQKEWVKAKAEQYIATDEPAFLWKVDMKMLPFIDVRGRDLFKKGEGQMKIVMASLIPLVNVSNNEKLNQSTLQRYLLELPWYPSAALSPYITWESINESSVKATMSYKGVVGSATYYFNNDGDLEKVSSLRYKDTDENAILIECIGDIKETSVIDGIEIPTKMDVSWLLEEGKFTWYKINVYDIKFN